MKIKLLYKYLNAKQKKKKVNKNIYQILSNQQSIQSLHFCQ
jgi:hypothetical protein